MNCSEFQAALWDDELPPREADLSADAAAHLSACAECRRLWRDELLLARAIEQWKPLPPATISVDAVVAAVRRELSPAPAAAPPDWRAARAARSPLAGRPMLACALAALAAVGWGLAGRLAPPPAVTQLAGVSQHFRDDAPALPVPVTDSVVELIAEVGRGSQVAAVETVNSFEHLPSWTPAAVVSAPPPDAPPAEAPPTKTPWQTVGRPIGLQIGEAFQFLRVALPESPQPPAS